MQLEKLVEALTFHRGRFPRAAVTEAVQRQQEITPALLEMIAYTHGVADKLEHLPEDYIGHMMACFLLAQFREPRAYRPIVNLFSPTREIIVDSYEDFLTESLSSVLASVFDGDLAPLKGMIENADTDVYVRGAALEALVILVGQGVLPRSEVMDYCVWLFDEGLEKKPSFVWDALVECACELHPAEIMDHIRRAYADELADTGYRDMAWVEKDLAKSQETVLGELAKDRYRQFITDTAHEFSDWVMFTPDYWPDSVKKQQGAAPRSAAPRSAAPRSATQASARNQKPGRNDPCPCGSGRKYKHCCGRRTA